MNELMLESLKKHYEVIPVDIGKDGFLSNKGMNFEIKCYEVKDLGHLCLMKMTAMLGLMKMETAVLSADQRDVPLFNMDRVVVFGNKTQIIELYDSQIEPLSEEDVGRYVRIKKEAPVPKPYEAGEHWYDSLLYPFSYRAKGRDAKVFDDICQKYIDEYIRQAKAAPKCDHRQKQEKNRVLPEGLVKNGGPAVNQFRKLFGEETARRIVLNRMYGLDI